MSEAKGPANPIDVLKGFVKRIEEGKMKGWIFLYPLHAVYVHRVIETTGGTELDSTTEFNVAFLCDGGGLSSNELRWVASKLIEQANHVDEISEKWKKGELG